MFSSSPRKGGEQMNIAKYELVTCVGKIARTFDINPAPWSAAC